jgi:hypothetical protein
LSHACCYGKGSPTTLLAAQLIVAKAAASKKQQKKDEAKVCKKNQDKENQGAEPKAEKGNGKNIRIS